MAPGPNSKLTNRGFEYGDDSDSGSELDNVKLLEPDNLR